MKGYKRFRNMLYWQPYSIRTDEGWLFGGGVDLFSRRAMTG